MEVLGFCTLPPAVILTLMPRLKYRLFAILAQTLVDPNYKAPQNTDDRVTLFIVIGDEAVLNGIKGKVDHVTNRLFLFFNPDPEVISKIEGIEILDKQKKGASWEDKPFTFKDIELFIERHSKDMKLKEPEEVKETKESKINEKNRINKEVKEEMGNTFAFIINDTFKVVKIRSIRDVAVKTACMYAVGIMGKKKMQRIFAELSKKKVVKEFPETLINFKKSDSGRKLHAAFYTHYNHGDSLREAAEKFKANVTDLEMIVNLIHSSEDIRVEKIRVPYLLKDHSNEEETKKLKKQQAEDESDTDGDGEGT